MQQEQDISSIQIASLLNKSHEYILSYIKNVFEDYDRDRGYGLMGKAPIYLPQEDFYNFITQYEQSEEQDVSSVIGFYLKTFNPIPENLFCAIVIIGHLSHQVSNMTTRNKDNSLMMAVKKLYKKFIHFTTNL